MTFPNGKITGTAKELDCLVSALRYLESQKLFKLTLSEYQFITNKKTPEGYIEILCINLEFSDLKYEYSFSKPNTES